MIAFIYVAAWYAFGKVEISARCGDQELVGAKVVIDGENAGKTPYETRLSPGFHEIRVIPPESASALQTEWKAELAIFVRGDELQAQFDTKELKSSEAVTATTGN